MKRCSGKSLKGSSNKDYVAFIPVRGGSKSIPLKNIKLFCGKPLVYWAIEAASRCEAIDVVYVATEDQRIKEVVEGFSLPKVQVVSRGPETITDEASTESALLEFANQVDFDNIILIQATSPILESEDLTGGIQQFELANADSLVSVVRQKRFLWHKEGAYAKAVNYEPAHRPRRQEWEGFLVENGAFYITSREKLLASNCRISGNISVYEMKEETYFEIDELSDWVISEQLKKRSLEKHLFDGVDFKKINLFISDVDGVLTNAGMYYSENGDELKKFNTRDGKGIELLRNEGIKVMFLTSESVGLVRKRGEKLKIDYIYLGVGNKKEFLEGFFKENPQFGFDKTAYIGDDVNDLDCLRNALFSATPSDGVTIVKDSVKYLCSHKGGEGCVREICDLIISRRNNG